MRSIIIKFHKIINITGCRFNKIKYKMMIYILHYIDGIKINRYDGKQEIFVTFYSGDVMKIN